MDHTATHQILAVDIQERFLPHITQYSEVVNNTEKLLTAAELLSLEILLFEQYPQGLGRTDERLIGFHIRRFEKTSFSALNDPLSKAAISLNPTTIKVVVGLEAHVCVYQTVQDLLRLKQPVIVVADAIASRNIQHKAWAIDQLRNDGAIIMSLEAVLFDILKDAKHPHFKAISKLIR
ncbi:isochorismatase family protein [Pseudoalteromonas luteoviolacea]|uniref:Isochorismatase-like domain-containing protein n=1 Tax=Pseudoalteromonas luteoviolacea S4054 TaxID=1129367 RepID=A0A0F6A5N5_9GAMM|nr:isochorismatase family protein [Pseudoalteromonas luteoviolacea]AOT10541.1 hypothetical protein S4054249_22010 [Pseudoalteromonas luteoviolacea]AOT15391.1 hypothetical protein S40542_21585 [Pseudoalteromonas luteoviolacea]AOT20360.1 hypothetical protein S4054_21925 [Pseudoalteromonas luteoviolacea]KKE81495.1 hypothetical protein N479_03145 [Pseudoalteromonas luteoviolacea S4054]KZN71608.1 hypothetical protein N481_18235 [Pseudoalteromonas luteoviolacea S4047-1]